MAHHFPKITLIAILSFFSCIAIAKNGDTEQEFDTAYNNVSVIDSYHWLDTHHRNTKGWLNKTAHKIDDWFGTTNPNKPARASLRVMLDTHYNTYDNTTIKPRIRGKIKLPTLEQRFSVIVGDDDLEHESGGGTYNDTKIATDTKHLLDKQQSYKDNSSLALRWSKLQDELGVDIDLGIRSNDVFVRMRGEHTHQLTKHLKSQFEHSYRYGSRSEHFAQSVVEFRHTPYHLANRTHLSYTHRNNEDTLSWGNSLYRHHHWQVANGMGQLHYGVYLGGDVIHSTPQLNAYGPYVSYKQPLWREWLFVQTDISYYNNKTLDRPHHLSAFGRLELIF